MSANIRPPAAGHPPFSSTLSSLDQHPDLSVFFFFNFCRSEGEHRVAVETLGNEAWGSANTNSMAAVLGDGRPSSLIETGGLGRMLARSA